MQIDKYTPFMEAMEKSSQHLKTTLPSNKTFDTNRYGGVSSAVERSVAPTSASTGKSLTDVGTVTVPWMGSTRYEPRGTHKGVDIGAPRGTPIRAFMGGEIVSVVRGKKHGDPAFGNYIILKDKQGGLHRYSHLHQSWANVGARVPRGAVIGTVGSTGQTYSASGRGEGPHLDYRVQRQEGGQHVNPLAYVIKNISAQYARR